MNANYVPALGRPELTQDYDRVIAIMTRERKWRSAFLELVAPKNGETIVDIGAGTGTFAIMLKSAAPDSHIIATDPDPAVLAIAAEKAGKAGVEIAWVNAMGDDLSTHVTNGAADKVVSSLVFHQCPIDMKLQILRSARRVLKASGRLLVADYGLQRTPLMKLLFRQVQMLDGWEGTTPNAKGLLPELMTQVGFSDPQEVRVIQTPTGSISLYTANAS